MQGAGSGAAAGEGWAELFRLAAGRHGVFSSAEARAVGVSRYRLRSEVERGTVDRLHQSVWKLASHSSSPEQAMWAALLARPDGALSHTSSLWMHDLVQAPPNRTHLWLPRSKRAGLEGVDVHRSDVLRPGRDIIVVRGCRVVNAAVALCQSGSLVDADVLEAALDRFLLTHSAKWLDAELERWLEAGSPTAVLLRDVIRSPRRVAGVTDSWFERVVARLADHPEIPELVLQYEIQADGRRFRIDIGVPLVRLGIEAHGRTFHWGKGKEDADNVRDLILAAEGWELLYVTWSQLHDPDEFVRLLVKAVHARAALMGLELQPRSRRFVE